MPISGRSSFFPKDEYYFPKPLIEVGGRPMIERVVRALQTSNLDPEFCFVISADEARGFSLDASLRILGGEGTRVVQRSGETSGGLCSALLAVGELDADAPLIVANGDQVIDAPLGAIVTSFVNRSVDAGVVVFRSVHPRWSYIAAAEKNTVSQSAEKRIISDLAIAGFYYFKTASIFFENAKKAILSDDHVDGLFYFSSTVNQIILDGGEVAYSEVPTNRYHSLYSPDKIKEFELSSASGQLATADITTSLVRVLIPAAGEGSRFAEQGWRKPKPFIDVNGKAMLEHVVGNVTPAGAETTLLLRSTHLESCIDEVERLKGAGCNVREVASLTQGTACTILLARTDFDDERPLLIANSDQLVEFDVTKFIENCFERELDGSILVFRDDELDPKWSFAKVNASGLVDEVAEKRAISDLATVGIYLFRHGNAFARAAIDMIVRNDRVNGEFYTCPVYNYMIKEGAKIGVFEVPRNAMKGLGTPGDLQTYLDEIGAPASVDSPH